MRAKDDLFHLIKAMSKSEKRYFTLDAKKSGREGAKYLELFQVINGMEDYEEQKLKRKFPRNLSSDKGYLYEAILRSMRDYRSAKSKTAQIKERLMDSRYLYERGLYGQFEDRMKEAKSMVLELEDKFTLLEINKEEQLAKYELGGFSKDYLKYLEELNLEKEKTLKAVLEELKFLDLYFHLSVLVAREFVFKEDSRTEELKKSIPPELEDDNFMPHSAHAKLRFLKCRALYYQLIGNSEQVYQNFLKVVDWWDQHSTYKEEEYFRYIIDVSNLLNTCFRNKAYRDQIPAFLERLKKENPNNQHEQEVLFKKVSISNLLYYFLNNDFSGAKNQVPEIEKGLRKFSTKKDIVLLGNITIVYFMTSDYEECQKWANQVIDLKTGKRLDIQRFMRLINLIALYELEEIDTLESAIRSNTRYFKKQELSKDRFEMLVLGYLKKIFNTAIQEKKTAMMAFKDFLEERLKNPKTSKSLGLDEFLFWINTNLKF